MKKRQLLLVEWLDIAGGNNWEDEDKDYTGDVWTCWTVGWQLKSNRKVLVLASTMSDKKLCNDRTIIPRVVIKSIKKLE